MTPRVTRAAVDQELARAGGARRILPWAIASAAGGAALGFVAGGGARAAAVLLAVGLVFALFLWVTAIARCPACGAPLPRPRRGRASPPEPAGGGRLESCPRCRARFE